MQGDPVRQKIHFNGIIITGSRMTSKKEAKPKPPKHLKPATKAWFQTVCSEYALEEHHIRLLALACEAFDRGEQARAVIAKLGMTYSDRYGCPKPRPELAVERDSRTAFARLTRELDLDCGQLAETRPPALHSNRRA